MVWTGYSMRDCGMSGRTFPTLNLVIPNKSSVKRDETYFETYQDPVECVQTLAMTEPTKDSLENAWKTLHESVKLPRFEAME